ncbi:MAG: aminotransferase class IV [Tidjanibacter sp.]|nr:aminotransferase class IV [Tidjanibacter sp.]
MSLYLYAIINTLGYRPLHLTAHLHKMWEGAQTLYGTTPSQTEVEVEQMIMDRLSEERMPRGGNTIELRAEQSGGHWTLSLHNPTPTIYEGYSYLSLRPSAVIINHELPFSRWRTSCSALTTEFGADFAERQEAGVAIRADRNGNFVSCGDNPLFCVRNGVVYTLPVSSGGRDSVERDLMFRLCALAGVPIIESFTPIDNLGGEWDEIIIFEPCGVRSIGSCSGYTLDYSTALRLEQFVHKLL